MWKLIIVSSLFDRRREYMRPEMSPSLKRELTLIKGSYKEISRMLKYFENSGFNSFPMLIEKPQDPQFANTVGKHKAFSWLTNQIRQKVQQSCQS